MGWKVSLENHKSLLFAKQSLVLISNPANPSQISAELWGSKSDSLPKASQRDSVGEIVFQELIKF